MKKARFLLIFMAVLALFLTGCNGKKEPAPIEKAQQRVVEIGEQFLNYEITASEAKEMLDSILVPETEGNGQTFLKGDIAALQFNIISVNATYEAVQKKVQYIKEANYTN